MAGRLHIALPSARDQRRLVIGLALMTLLLWVGGSAIVPLLPTYLHARGASSSLVGAVMASYFALSVLTQYPVGRLSDRIGPRPVIMAGLIVFVVGSVGFALVSGAGPAIAFRSLQGIGAGAVTVAGAAMVAVRVEPSERGSAYAVLFGGQSLALAVGPLAGSIVGASSMRLLFLVAAGFALFGALPVLLAMREPDLPVVVDQGRAVTGSGARMIGPAFVGGLLVFGAVGLLGGLYESCWSLLLHDRGASSISIGLSWTLYCLPYTLLSGPAGRLADHRDRRLLVLIGIASSAGFALLYPELHNVALLVTLGCAEAVGAVLVTPAALSVLAESTPDDRHGAAQGALATSRTACTAVAAAGCGSLYGIGVFLPFGVIATLLAICGSGAAWSWRSLPARATKSTAAEAPAPI